VSNEIIIGACPTASWRTRRLRQPQQPQRPPQCTGWPLHPSQLWDHQAQAVAILLCLPPGRTATRSRKRPRVLGRNAARRPGQALSQHPTRQEWRPIFVMGNREVDRTCDCDLPSGHRPLSPRGVPSRTPPNGGCTKLTEFLLRRQELTLGAGSARRQLSTKV